MDQLQADNIFFVHTDKICTVNFGVKMSARNICLIAAFIFFTIGALSAVFGIVSKVNWTDAGFAAVVLSMVVN